MNNQKRWDRVLDWIAGGIAVASVLGFAGKVWWGFDLFSHFRVQYFQACLILIGVTLWRRQNKRAIALVVLTCFNYAFILPFYLSKPYEPISPTARVMQLNLNAGNSNTEKVLRVIKKNNPDLLLLEEVTPQWAKALSGLSTNYPHQISEPQTDCFGIILLSKVPLKQGKIVDIGSTGVPSIVAEAHFPLGTITVIGTHPLPPISANYSAKRNQLLAALPQLIKEQHYPVLLMGDLNLSPWSPYFKQLLRDSELKNSMKGFGFQPSWPSRIHLLRIPLDHLLYSSEIRIHSRQIGENVGSDHFPLFVEFSIPPKK